ncbi:hypothetical protein H2198_001541 [Neophaeococcomyces mojaviensis]|uniref:Uncharacterized protein n=1 Tax=Neophaeococcomyces mojaviensis TaxID=3383035 RepID=A0ACC3AHB5_9EURO|nr:hypothetical protein H2198_001541 [Knufia sp. JES_112]
MLIATMSLKLDPEYAMAAAPIMAMMVQAPVPADHDVDTRRTNFKAGIGALLAAMPAFPDVEIIEHKIISYDGAGIVVYQTRNTGADAGPGPAIVHAHGGGMIAGDAVTLNPAVKTFVSMSCVQFFDVEYRLAPEHPHPTLVEDTYAALTWLHEHAAELQVDKTRIGVMGESVGGGIVAGVTLMARDRKLQPPLAKSILIYPMLDSRNIKPVVEDLDQYLVWTVGSNLTGWKALLGDELGSDDVSPYASPSHVKSVEGLPSTYTDCGSLDLFRDEVTEYARRLAAANVDVEYHLYPGVPHGFEILAPDVSVAKQALANRIKALKSF